jgi:putative phage-type endonuclease
MEQNTNAWLEWRGEGLGSSDAPAIMGESPYLTPYELWLQKTGRKAPEEEKFAFDLGHRAEPFIRAAAEEKLDEIFEPVCITSEEYPFMRASLDGATLGLKAILEIKVNTFDVHTLLPSKPEALPRYHYWQIQHQLVVSCADVCYYASSPFMEDFSEIKPDDLYIMRVTRHIPACEDMIRKEGRFIELLANDDPPPLCDRDGVHIRTAAWKRNAEKWIALNSKIRTLKQQQDKLADRLKQMSNMSPVARGYGVCVKNTKVNGNIQYKKVPELDGVDLDKYRAKGYIKSTVGED